MAFDFTYQVDFNTLPDDPVWETPEVTYLNSIDPAFYAEIESGVLQCIPVGKTVKPGWGTEITDYSVPIVSQVTISGAEMQDPNAPRGPAILVRSGPDQGKGYWLSARWATSSTRLQLFTIDTQDTGAQWTLLKANYTDYDLQIGDTVELSLNPNGTLTGFYNGVAISTLTDVPLTAYTDDLVPATAFYRTNATVSGNVLGLAYAAGSGSTPPDPGPYPGLHTVTNLAEASNPYCLYNGQDMPISVGTKISFAQVTTTNNWGVSIDNSGFWEVAANGAIGLDTFQYAISNDAGVTWSAPGTINTTTEA